MILSIVQEASNNSDSNVNLWTVFLVLGCLAFLAILFRRFR